MRDLADLFQSDIEDVHGTGVLPSQALKAAIARRWILSQAPIEPAQIQPASLDLRLGHEAWRVNASFLPGPASTVEEKLDRLATDRFALGEGAVLERGCVYIVPLQERLDLRKRLSAMANPKSSIGRLDIFARVITDRGAQFDNIPEQYEGPLYLEVAPRTFSIRVRPGSKLAQIRLRRGSPPSSEKLHKDLQRQHGIISGDSSPDITDRGITFTVDIKGAVDGSIIGFRARKYAGLIDVDKVAAYDPREFWEPLHSRDGRGLVLDPEHFYILASKENVVVPPTHAAEMLAYDTLVGEFRVHYAGFFDPGFGHQSTGGEGTRAVLEVRSHEVPFLIEDGQTVGRLAYERLAAPPEVLYGAQVGSYQRQRLALAKHFRPWA